MVSCVSSASNTAYSVFIASTAAFAIPSGTTRRINTFGQEARALAVSRTSGQTEAYTFTLTPLDGTSPTASDFDRSGRVAFDDFLLFVAGFGRSADDAEFDPTYDLDGDRRVGFTDFLIFVSNYGATL